MTVQKRPNGRYAVTVYDPTVGRRRQLGAWSGHATGTFDTKREARQAEAEAKTRRGRTADSETVASFTARWVTDFPRPKASTNRHNAERVSDFAAQHGRLRMSDVDARLVDRYLSADPQRKQRVPALRAMFNDAKRRGVVTSNPFAELGIRRAKGNEGKQPPSQEQVSRMLELAWDLTPPSFAAWLSVACYTGMRPGELDALRWSRIDFSGGWVQVLEQWNVGARAFTEPKKGPREIALTDPARAALLRLPRECEWAFPTVRGAWYTPSSRSHHWNRVRCAAGMPDVTLYLATRHFAGWWLTNIAELPSEDVALQLGHSDGGQLIRRLYGHRDRRRALERVKQAYAEHGSVRPLRVVREDTA